MTVRIEWNPEDVQTLEPEWDLDKCGEVLHLIGNEIQDRSIEYGWDTMATLLTLYKSEREA